MSENLENAKRGLYSAEQKVDIARNPVFKALINLIPAFGDLLDSSIDLIVTEFQEAKRQKLLEIILSDNERITSTMVSDVEFIISFAKVVNAVDRLVKNDKIEYFANLLKNSFLTNEKIDADYFDEYMYTIGIMSYKQMQLMIDLKNCPDKKEKIAFRDWVDDTQKKFDCSFEELNSEYLRLQGMGLCEKGLGIGEFSNPDYRDFDYYITPFFNNLLNYIQTKN